MPTTQFPKIPGPPNKPDLQALSAYVGQLANLLAVLSKELDYLLNGSLDVNNIRAHSITADTLNVDELSAITANLGTITAGIINGIEIYGSYIATANGTYPRVELSSTGNLFRAYLDADNYVEMSPSISGGAPGFFATVDGNVAYEIIADASSVVFSAIGKNLGIVTSVQGDIDIFPETGYNVKVPGWDTFLANGTGESLQAALDVKANTFSGFTGSFSTGTKTVNVSNGIITSVV